MSDVKNLTPAEVEQKLEAKQKKLGDVFAEAKGDSDKYDYSQVKSFGANLSSVGVAEKIQELSDEVDELAETAEKYRKIEQAEKAHSARSKGRRDFPLPNAGGQGGGLPANQKQFKSIGELVAGSDEYKSWSGRGRPQGIDFSFEDIFASDLMASKSAIQTLQTKALFATTSGFAPEVLRMPGFVEAATRPLQLIDIIPMSRTGQAAIAYMEETVRASAAAEIAEGAAYPEDAYEFTKRTSPVQKIGTHIPVTDEQLEDVPFMEDYLNGRLTFGIRQRLDTQCYIGDGANSNLRGIKSTAGIQTQLAGANPKMEAFYRAMTKIRLAGRAVPTHHVIHPTDWQEIRLTRTADGIYIFGSPTEAGPERLWGLPVAQNDADAAGSNLTGSFDPSWITLSERRGVDVQVGYKGDQFVQGQRSIRGDMRGALTLFRPPAFCEVDLTQ